VIEIACVKRVYRQLKRKTRNSRTESRQAPNSLIVIYASYYSTGGLLENQDSSTDNDSYSEAKRKLDDRLVQKKRKVEDS
jgi:hypothetical protein